MSRSTRIDLTGRVAIVTGGASGLGYAAARRFLTSGASVMLWDFDEATLSRSTAELAPLGVLRAKRVDISHYGDVEAGVADALAAFGRIDILLNCAGVTGPMTPGAQYPIADWDRVIAVNLTGLFYCCRLVIPAMTSRGWGRIINVTSMAGKDGNPMHAAYVASKAGVIGLTKSLGKELARAGVLVNAIAPGVFDTPLTAEVAKDNPDFIGGLVATIPVGRVGQPDEFAALATWLASDECSFTAGFTFDLSGGRATY